jgi:hypothetical protein
MSGLRWTAEDLAAFDRRLRGTSAPVAAPVPALLVKPAPDYSRFLMLCKAAGLPEPEREAMFHPTRKWRLDFAWPAYRVAVEVDGGLFSRDERARAAHSKPMAILRDMAKSNALALQGWRLLRYTPDQLEAAIPDIARLINGGSPCPQHAATPTSSSPGSKAGAARRSSSRRRSGA